MKYGKILCVRCGTLVTRHPSAKLCWECINLSKRKPLAAKAGSKVAAAKRAGIIPPASDLDCADCGKPACDYDHRDYTKPLEVEPVCRSCNCRRGPAHPYMEIYR